ncbi:MAG: hydrogenase nickel incorporation protein HypB [Pseudomonadota bacterium]
MCTVCGCGSAKIGESGQTHTHHNHDHAHDHAHGHHHHDLAHDHAHGHSHSHDHAQAHDHGDHHHHHGDHMHFGEGPARAHAPGLSQARMVEIETDILSKNNGYADANRARLSQAGTLALNLVSSPGSGKTTLLVETIRALKHTPVAVIEGDQETSNDADRIRETGAPAVQVNTGKGCHLDAHMVGHAMERLLAVDGVLFIENVGNLVCPAAFDLGEAAKVAILSVTEGEDKPLKYPDMFAASRLVIVNKVDLAPYCDTDLALIAKNIARVNPAADIIFLSAKTGEGMDAWLNWIDERREGGADVV